MNCLYLHIPFCRCRCHYCSFNSFAGLEQLHKRYGRALLKEISTLRFNQPLDSLFIGGGTPTVLETGLLVDLLENCADRFGFSDAAEISIEANPESVDAATLKDLRRAGFNRISLGVQSFEDSELKALGRIHSAAAADAAVSGAIRAGFSNISIDLMYGLPGQQVKSWRRSLDRALELGPRHLSIYQLSIEPDTDFFRLADAGLLELP
ncbi:MAG: radical SAM family heme chaperone HemW, partial [Desulfofustis sp.]